MKFLVIRFGSIGDIVLTSPVVRCLKKKVPEAEIHFLLEGRYKDTLRNNPFITAIYDINRSRILLLEELQKQHFDYVIDLQHNRLSKQLIAGLGVPAFHFNKRSFETFIFTRLKWNVMPQEHIVDRYLAAVASLGVQNDGAGLDYFIAPHEEVQQHDIPTSHHAGYIAIVIGASFYTKKLSVYKLQQLCAAIPHPIILLGAKEEYAEGEAIRSMDDVKIYNACGKFSLNESADLVRKSRLVIAHDTGLMHIAAALKKPVIAIWGSTTPSLGMTPYYGKNYLMQHAIPYNDVQVLKLWCRPCTAIGREHCPQGHFKCIKNISIEEIVQKAMARLALR